MNAYLDQMNRMSDTLRTGIGAIARDRLNRATLGLEEKKLDYALARDEREWNDPTKAFAREEAQGKLDAINQKKNTPFRFRNAFSDDPYGQSWALTPAKDGKSANDLLSEHIGAKINFDLAPDDPNYGAYIKPDGTPLSQYEWETLHRDSAQQQIIGPRADPFHMNRDHVERLQAKKGRGETLTPEDEEFLKQWPEVEKDPAKQIAYWQQRLNSLQGIDGPYIQQARERAEAKIEALRSAIDASEKTAYERRMAEREYQLRQAEAQGRAGGQHPAGNGPQAQGGQTQQAQQPTPKMQPGQPTPPAGMPAGAQQAPDGFWYVRDPNTGKALRVDLIAPDQQARRSESQPASAQASPGEAAEQERQRQVERHVQQGLDKLGRISPVGQQAWSDAAELLYNLAATASDKVFGAPARATGDMASNAVNDIIYWSKHDSPTARRLRGKEAVQQSQKEKSAVAEQLVRASLGGR